MFFDTYTIKKTIRYIFNCLFNKFNKSKRPPIIVASMGRCGSTILFDVIRDSLAKEIFPFLPLPIARIFCQGSLWLPGKKIFKGFVHKTHSRGKNFPLNSNPKIIYIFCIPSDSVLSAISQKSRKGKGWLLDHCNNFEVNGNYEDLAFHDVLRIEDNIKEWRNKKNTKILFIRYEKIWQYRHKIEEFINLKIKLPKYKSRRSLSKEAKLLKETCKKNYSYLDKIVKAYSDFEIIE